MQKSPLIGISLAVVCTIILTSYTNVIGVQTVIATNHSLVNDEVDQKELLFQTILDIANNKEVQKIILNSEIKREGFFNPDERFSALNTPVLTKNQLKHMYLVGLMLSKIISKSRMHSLPERYQISNQEVQKEITAVIEKDAIIKGKMSQLSNSKCDCGNENASWNFPGLCTLLWPIMIFLWPLVFWPWIIFNVQLHFFIYLYDTIGNIGTSLNCFWA